MIQFFLSKYRLQVVPSFPPRRSSRIERREMREHARKVRRGQKSERGRGQGEEEKGKWRLQTTHCYKICAAVGDLSILIGRFWLFHQQVSRHDGISSFSTVMTAGSFEDVLKLKPQQYSACSISKIFRRKSWDFLQSIRNRLIRWTPLRCSNGFQQNQIYISFVLSSRH